MHVKAIAIDRYARGEEVSAALFKFWRSVLVVLTGSAAAQAIPLIGSLIIARLFSPAEFGLFATWLGAVAVGSVVITGRYEMALAIENDGEFRRVAARATLLLVLCGGVILTLVSVLIGQFWFSNYVPTNLLWILGPAATLVAASQTWQSWAAANGNYRYLSTIRIVQAASITVLQVFVGLFDASAFALALAHLGGAAMGVLLSTYYLPVLFKSISSGAVLQAKDFLRKHKRFPIFALPADSINTIAAQLPLIVVAHRFGADVAGLLALTLRIVGAPIGLLGASVLDVFKRRSAASFIARGECHAEYLDTLRVLGIGSCIVAVFLMLSAEPAFVFFFGEKWFESGTIAIWLMPMFALRFAASPLSYMFYIAGKQYLDLFWQLTLLGTTLVTLWFPRGYEQAIKAYGLGYSMLYCIYLVMSYRLSKGK